MTFSYTYPSAVFVTCCYLKTNQVSLGNNTLRQIRSILKCNASSMNGTYSRTKNSFDVSCLQRNCIIISKLITSFKGSWASKKHASLPTFTWSWCIICLIPLWKLLKWFLVNLAGSAVQDGQPFCPWQWNALWLLTFLWCLNISYNTWMNI